MNAQDFQINNKWFRVMKNFSERLFAYYEYK